MPKLSDKTFNDRHLQSLKPKDKRFDTYDAATRGLGLRVTTTGIKSWFVMKRVNGRMKRITLGRYPALSLSQARVRATEVFNELASGTYTDKPHGLSFKLVMDEWLAADQAGNRSVAEVTRALEKDAIPVLGNVAIDAIGPKDIRGILDRIVARSAPNHANHVRAYLNRLFNWAVERDYVTASPCQKISAPSKNKSRDRVLSFDELQCIWRAADQMGYPFGPVVQLLILTGQRRGEVAGAKWDEINLEEKTWTIPADRAKNGRCHIVHLSLQALEVITPLPRFKGSQFLFTTTGRSSISGYSKAKLRLDVLSDVSGWTLHDLRRSFATHTTEKLDISPVVIDRILNHVSGAVTGIAAVYQRGQYLEQRKLALDSWATEIKHTVEKPYDFQ